MLQEADAEMEVIPKTPALDSARTALEKGIKLVVKRQLIKLADRLDYG